MDGVAFEGSGAFRFALLDGSGASLWSNDGTSVDGAEPQTAVTLELERGVYFVELGSTDYENMLSIEASVFDVDNLYLRVWFDDGSNGSQLLEPDTKIGSVAFSIRSETAGYADVAGSVESIPDGLIEDRHFNADLQEQISYLSAVVENLVAISSDSEDQSLLDSGFTAFRTLNESVWLEGSEENQPSGRFDHGTAWTGTEWFVWGGRNAAFQPLGTGSIYNAESDSWSIVSALNDPEPRYGAATVWTGSQYLVWGGVSENGMEQDGSIYDPATQFWNSISIDNAPEARRGFVSEWTGSSLAVWGGQGESGLLSDIHWYDPDSDSWNFEEFQNLEVTKNFDPFYFGQLTDPEDSGVGNWTNGIDEELPFIEGAWYVEADGDLLVLASAGDDSLSFFDISIPTEPVLIYTLIYQNSSGGTVADLGNNIGSIDNLNATWSISIEGDLLAATSHANDAVSIFDISDLEVLSRVALIKDTDNGGDLDYLDRPNDIRLDSDLLIVGNDAITQNGEQVSFTSLYIFEVSETHNSDLESRDPVQQFRFIDGTEVATTVENETVSLSMDGVMKFDRHENYLFMASSLFPYIYILDINQPASPVLIAVLEDEVDGFNLLGVVNDIEVSEDGLTLFVASSGGEDAVSIIDISNPDEPTLLSYIRNGLDDGTSGETYTAIDGPSVSIDGNQMAISGVNSDGVAIVDIEDLSNPKLIRQFHHGDNGLEMDLPRSVLLHHQVAYVPAQTSGTLSVFDMSPDPEPRMESESVWTGDSLAVFGGQMLNDDGQHGFVTEFESGVPTVWFPMNPENQPVNRAGHTIVSTGSGVIIWGGENQTALLDDGGYYDFESNTWTLISKPVVDEADEESEPVIWPSARKSHSAVWTGAEMLILGGRNESGDLSDGYAFNPVDQTWRQLSEEGASQARSDASAVWNGDEVLMFGGRSNNSALNDLRILNPEPDLYLFRKR